MQIRFLYHVFIVLILGWMTACTTVPREDSRPAPVMDRSSITPSRPDARTEEIIRSRQQAVVSLLDQAKQSESDGNLVRAAALYERALRIAPSDAEIWYFLAQLRYKQDDFQQAESLAQKSRVLAKDDLSLQQRNWKLIADARTRRGDSRGAEAALQKLQTIKLPEE
jgi:tetratricopeptide (TPR) repeat protein